jgi:hypothetical protein
MENLKTYIEQIKAVTSMMKEVTGQEVTYSTLPQGRVSVVNFGSLLFLFQKPSVEMSPTFSDTQSRKWQIVF